MFELLCGDAASVLSTLPDGSVNLTVTSPPYFRLKDYGVAGQIGWENTIEEYVSSISRILREVYRLTTTDGSCFVVVGDSYIRGALQLVPHRIALAAVDLGWIIRNDLIWAKLDPSPGRATFRWRTSHEHILFLTKLGRGYKFDMDSIRVPYAARTIARWSKGQQYGGPKSLLTEGSVKRRFAPGKTFKLNPKGTIPADVLQIAAGQSSHAHFATFPRALIQKFIIATTSPGDVVLDPFTGSGTTGIAAVENGRKFIGIDLNAEYLEIAANRLEKVGSVAFPDLDR